MKYAICNETFEGWEHARICGYLRKIGYTGLEIAPFTLASRITEVNQSARAKLRKEAEKEDVKIIGLHWLLAKTEGFCLTSPDVAVRKNTAGYLEELGRACVDLGGDILVLGSPAQRRIPVGHTKEQATEFAVDTLKRTVKVFGDLGVKLCLEPLSPPEADFVNTAGEGAEILRQIGHPNYLLHLDVKAMSTEPKPTPEVIREFIHLTGHFHANDPNLRGPGFGSTDFVPIFQALLEKKYSGWVSVEVFDYKPDPETIAEKSLEYMKACVAKARNLLNL